MADTEHLLAPSESVLLSGEQFATKSIIPVANAELLHTETKVEGSDLAKAILTIAFLAAEQAGSIRLVLQTKKALFGLVSSKVISVEKAGSTIAWPAHSLEATIVTILANGPAEVGDIVYHLLNANAEYPGVAMVNRVKAGMAERGLLDAQEVKLLKVFKSVKYTLLPQTAALAGSQSVAPYQQLLNEARQGRADLLKLLQNGVATGLSRRTAQSDVRSATQ